jgi:hypothetical protein
MKFFNIDCHVSVIADLKNIFEGLGHEVTSWSLSGHTWVFNQIPSKIELLADDQWKFLDQEKCDLFYEQYKDQLSEYDAFIVTYPTPFALLYEKFNKPIIVQIPIRYEYPFTSSQAKWKWLNQYLTEGSKSGKIVVVSNNKYDQYYANCWIDIDIKYIPSLCEYTNATYDQKLNYWILNSRLNFDIDEINLLDKSNALGNGYSWSKFYQYSGLIDFPYCNSTMSIFEQYTAGFPMLFPSKELLKELYFEYFDLGPKSVLHEMSFHRICQLSNSSTLIPTNTVDDPNDYKSENTIDKFLNLCDYYDTEWMPAIKHFNNFNDMVEIIKEPGSFDNDNRPYRKEFVYKQWTDIIGNLK